MLRLLVLLVMARAGVMGLAIPIAMCFSFPSAAQDPPGGKPRVDQPAKPKGPAKPTAPPAKKPDVKKKADDGPTADEAAPPADAAEAEAPAEAQKPPSACPPGAFCEDQEVAPPEGEAEVAPDKATAEAEDPHGTTVKLPPPRKGQDPNKPRTFTYVPDPDGGPGQVIIYEDGAAPPHMQGERVEETPPPRHRWHRHRRWGMNLRVQGILLPRTGDVDDVGMAGLGLSLRYRPVPAFALDLGADFVGGVDTNGNERQEIPIAASALIYVNPRNLAQFYLMGGLNWAFARVFSDEFKENLANGTSDEYTYFGGHLGMGLEFRVSRLVGINVDGVAFVRTRTDEDGDGRYPEYLDPETGQSSNASTAGLLRAGVTFWW